ncbi:hypothetical protein RUND412_004424 [Rhizina undulata]
MASSTPSSTAPPALDSLNTFPPSTHSTFIAEDQYSSTSEDEAPVNPEAEALLTRAETILSEVEAFQKALRRNKLDKTVELRHFLSGVKSERASLLGLSLQPANSSKTCHALRSSNISYLEAVWRAAKSTTGITALLKTFHFSPDREKLANGKLGKRQKSVVSVDVVAQNGLQWIKVCTLNTRRLLFDIAKEGWSSSPASTPPSSDRESESPDKTPSSSETTLALPHLPIIKLAEVLCKAASQTKVQYLHPQVTLLFPHLPGPSTSPILTAFVSHLLSMGARVQCGLEMLDPPVSIETLLQTLEINSARFDSFTEKLNIDTTILLALISDITHQPIPIEPRFHPAILRQLETESEAPILPKILIPALASHPLVCTNSSKLRFQEIVSLIGSPTELRRASLLFAPLSPEEIENPKLRIQAFANTSIHEAPQLRLPIEVLKEDLVKVDDVLVEERMKAVSQKLSVINRSVFVTGWKLGLTTITSNRNVVKIIEGIVEQDGGVGPDENGSGLNSIPGDTARDTTRLGLGNDRGTGSTDSKGKGKAVVFESTEILRSNADRLNKIDAMELDNPAAQNLVCKDVVRAAWLLMKASERVRICGATLKKYLPGTIISTRHSRNTWTVFFILRIHIFGSMTTYPYVNRMEEAACHTNSCSPASSSTAAAAPGNSMNQVEIFSGDNVTSGDLAGNGTTAGSSYSTSTVKANQEEEHVRKKPEMAPAKKAQRK